MNLIERLRAVLSAPSGAELRSDWDIAPDHALADHVLTPAAVLIPIVTRPRPTLLFTRRTDTLRRHAGQVAFPGGRIDPEDADAISAALREAHEEIALPPRRVEVIGAFDDYETATGYRITPIVGLVPPDLPLVPCAAEVAGLFEAPLDHLLDPANHQLREMEWQGQLRRYYAIDWETHHIWGATAAMIVNLARRINRGMVA